MGLRLAEGSACRSRNSVRRFFPAILLMALLAAGCHQEPPVDTSPLDSAGMSYDTIQQLKASKITAPEISELAKARGAGLPDSSCLDLLRVYRSRSQPFNAGDNVAGLLQAGVAPATVVELARLNQLGLQAGEFQAMRLADLPDDILLEVARRRAEGKTVLSGASLAGMKNAGLRDATLLELARRGISDSQTNNIVALRRRGMKDAEILRHFSGPSSGGY